MILFFFGPEHTASIPPKKYLKYWFIWPQYTFPLCDGPSQMPLSPEKSTALLDTVNIGLILTKIRQAAKNNTTWKAPCLYQADVQLGLTSRRKVVMTDAYNSGWGAQCDGRLVFGSWSSLEQRLHINCLERMVVFSGPQNLPSSPKRAPYPPLFGQHDYGSLYNSPGQSQAMDPLQNGEVPPLVSTLKGVVLKGSAHWTKECTCGPGAICLLYMEIFGEADVDLFTSEDNSHCTTFFSNEQDALAHEWTSARLYAFFMIALLPQVIRQFRLVRCSVLLVAPFWQNQSWFPELVQLSLAAPWQILLRNFTAKNAFLT